MSRRTYAKVLKLSFSPEVPFSPSRLPFFYGWVIMIVGTLGMLCSIPAQTAGVGVFTDVLIRELGLSRVQLGFAYCIATSLSGLLLPWGGRLLDRWGARTMVLLIAVSFGGVLIALSQSDRLAAQMNVWLGNPGGWGTPFAVIILGCQPIRLA